MSDQQHASQNKSGAPDREPVWTYRGYQLHAGEFTTAMVHFFRAEISRANIWRQRLDTTTNWAVISTGAAITVAFGQDSGYHGVIILNMLLITLFLFIEARRYRYYEVWSTRVRLMETDFFAAMLVPPFGPSPDWAESLAENLLQPHFSVSLLEAIGRRYRRNYFWIFLILGIAWFVRVWLFPTQAANWDEFFVHASIGPIPGEWVLGIGIIYQGFWVLVGVLTLGLQEASGEVLPRFDLGPLAVSRDTEQASQKDGRSPWYRHSHRRQQLLAFIITDQAETVSDGVLKELHRGVTALPGKGMYTGSAHTVLMCALTVTETVHLKAVVSRLDAKAFVIVTPAQEILGRGFNPLVQNAD